MSAAHWILCGLVAVGAIAGRASGVASQEELFREGNRLYQQGDFEGALDSYLRIVDAGFESGALHYNVGNTYFKLGDLGRAILHYERALRLTPRDEDLLANVELARSLTADDITPLPGFWLLSVVRWWLGLLSRPLLLALVTVGYLTTMTMVVHLILRPEVARIWVSRTAITAATVTVLLGLNLLAVELELGTPEQAVILTAEVAVQSAPSDDPSLQLFSIHEGTRVRVDRRSDAWIEIVLDDGKVGWVPADALEVI